MAPRYVLQIMQMMFALVRKLFADRADLAAENLALPQQLAVLNRRSQRPRLNDIERAFWAAMKNQFENWAGALIIVKPDTVVRWHRDAFRRHWAKESAHPPGRPAISTNLRNLIRRMANANPTWGSPRVHGELLKLGIEVAGMGISEVKSAPRSPWQNPYVERMIGSIRRDCLDHVVVLNEWHLRRILRSYFDYYHGSRTHLSLYKDSPVPRPVHPPDMGGVVEFPEVGGLHHRYERRAAA